MSSSAQSEPAKIETKGLDVWYKNKCHYCSRELFLSKSKQDEVYSHRYCYWIDMLSSVKYQRDDSSDDDDELGYSLSDEIRLEAVYNIPKGTLARFNATQEYCVLVK